jgi:predicted  nucleic acid-binding Zn-ribbon protein
MTPLILNAEANIKDLKAAILTSGAAACRLKALEPEAQAAGVDTTELATMLDHVTTRIRKLAEAERALHEAINRAAPSGPVAMIGT